MDDDKKRKLVIMAGLVLALGAAIAFGTRGGGGGRPGSRQMVEPSTTATLPSATAEQPISAPASEGPSDSEGRGGARGSRSSEQSRDGSRQDPDAETAREKEAARADYEERLQRTREAIATAEREGRSADAARLRDRLADLEAHPVE